MDDEIFEGTLVLEKLALIGKVDDFFAAIDGDDFTAAKKMLKEAKVPAETIAIVLRKMAEANGDH